MGLEPEFLALPDQEPLLERLERELKSRQHREEGDWVASAFSVAQAYAIRHDNLALAGQPAKAANELRHSLEMLDEVLTVRPSDDNRLILGNAFILRMSCIHGLFGPGSRSALERQHQSLLRYLVGAMPVEAPPGVRAMLGFHLAQANLTNSSDDVDDLSKAALLAESARGTLLQIEGLEREASLAGAVAGEALLRRARLRSIPSGGPDAGSSRSPNRLDDFHRAARFLADAWTELRGQLDARDRLRLGLNVLHAGLSSPVFQHRELGSVIEEIDGLVDKRTPNAKWMQVEWARGAIAAEAKDFKTAQAAEKRAADLAANIGDPSFQVTALLGLAQAYLLESRAPASLKIRERLLGQGFQALSTAIRCAERCAEPEPTMALLNAGCILVTYDHDALPPSRCLNEAVGFLTAAIARPAIRLDPYQLFRASRSLALAFAGLGRKDEAFKFYSMALAARRAIRSVSVALISAASAMIDEFALVEEAAYVALELKRPGTAFGILENERVLALRSRLTPPPDWGERLRTVDPPLFEAWTEAIQRENRLRELLEDGLLGQEDDERGSTLEQVSSDYQDTIERIGELVRQASRTLGGIDPPAVDLSGLLEKIGFDAAIAYLLNSKLGSAALVLRRRVDTYEMMTIWLPETDEVVAAVASQTDDAWEPGTWPKWPTDERLRILGGMYRNLADYLRTGGVKTVYLVSTGLASKIPVTCAPYATVNGERRLCEEFTVSQVPCGEALLSSIETLKSLDCSSARFGGAVHAPGLPFAELEVLRAEQLFGPAATCNRAATLMECEDLATHAQFIHLACHGGARGGTRGPFARVWLRDGSLTEFDILRDRVFAATRLVVAAACRTGEVELSRGLDESMSLANCLLASGTAGVIATLQPVDDFAACVVLTRFYEELLGAGTNPCSTGSPAAALGRVQTWFARADREEVQAYVRGHEVLGTACERYETERPVSAWHYLVEQNHWALFVCLGC